MYALFLGFGLAIGASIWQAVAKQDVIGTDDYTCTKSHVLSDGPWYRQTPSMFWAFLTVPMFSFFLSLRNYASWKRKELVSLSIIDPRRGAHDSFWFSISRWRLRVWAGPVITFPLPSSLVKVILVRRLGKAIPFTLCELRC